MYREQFMSRGRYTVIPRTLVFLLHDDCVLLLRGAADKRLWAGRYNGLGGHVEADETLDAAALREVREEAGIESADIGNFTLRALINVHGTPHGVLLCVFFGTVRSRTVVPSREGLLEWIPISRLPEIDLVDGERLLTVLLNTDHLLFGHVQASGTGNVLTFTLG